MDGLARGAYEEKSLQLRTELKKWENDWAIAHGGKKPGRDDIKQNPDIAQKYKQYNNLRDILAGRVPSLQSGPVEAAHGHQQRKRKQFDAALAPQTPSKRTKPDQTHSQIQVTPSGAQTPSAAHAVLTPSLNRTSLTPVGAVPTSISPTPQKDGRVLGLFDLLGRTPSKSTTTSSAPPNTTLLAATPRNQRTVDPLAPTVATTTTTAGRAITPQHQRTTTTLLFQSSTTTTAHARHAKRITTTTTITGATPFRTPSTNRISKQPLNSPTGSASSSTPSFLRRRTVTTADAAAAVLALSSVDELDEDRGGTELENADEAWKKIVPLRLPRKLGAGIGRRSLSSVVAGLRKMEEEAFGEEEEVLREMGMEMSGGAHSPAAGLSMKKNGVDSANKGGELVEVGDSQVQGEGQQARMTTEPRVGFLSGFDEEGLYGSSNEDNNRQNQQQQPLRTFKKRGQKRSTRLLNMRPTRTKRPAQQSEHQEEEEEEEDIVHETQPNTTKSTAAAAAHGEDLRLSDLDSSASEADFNAASDSDEEEEERVKTAKTKQKSPALPPPGDKDKNDKGESVVKRAVRKVKATAHANFKRLKLRNSGAKGGPGYGSRFRRRR
ncbi:hypothetical protein N657DRAFT_655602 [Parathielavia appendiculata]|uniref:DNA replication regulator SLD2 n=1 Tax=Parathielavia appendiculata TaxID=2587402 RepID=A0AAN6U1X3_9PEZI|nr:hypothetical protein N657DRAFT_655602 [Parathielavia appendiculata]